MHTKILYQLNQKVERIWIPAPKETRDQIDLAQILKIRFSLVGVHVIYQTYAICMKDNIQFS